LLERHIEVKVLGIQLRQRRLELAPRIERGLLGRVLRADIRAGAAEAGEAAGLEMEERHTADDMAALLRFAVDNVEHDVAERRARGQCGVDAVSRCGTKARE